ASGGRDQVLCLWDAETGRECKRLGAASRGLSSILFTPDGMTLLAVGERPDRSVQFWDMASGRGPRVFPELTDIDCLALSPDGTTLAAAVEGGTVRLWDLSAEKEVGQIPDVGPGCRHLAFSPDGKVVASVGAHGKLRLWDRTTGQAIRDLG